MKQRLKEALSYAQQKRLEFYKKTSGGALNVHMTPVETGIRVRVRWVSGSGIPKVAQRTIPHERIENAETNPLIEAIDEVCKEVVPDDY